MNLDLSPVESSVATWTRGSKVTKREVVCIQHSKVGTIYNEFVEAHTLTHTHTHSHIQAVKQVTWHSKGDYLATVSADGECEITLLFISHTVT